MYTVMVNAFRFSERAFAIALCSCSASLIGFTPLSAAVSVAGAAAAAQQAAESKVTELAEGAVAINTQNITDIKTVLDTHGDIVTHNAAEFATAAQGALADTALQDADVHALGKSGDLYDSVNVGTAKDTAGEDVPCFVFYCGTASDLV